MWMICLFYRKDSEWNASYVEVDFMRLWNSVLKYQSIFRIWTNQPLWWETRIEIPINSCWFMQKNVERVKLMIQMVEIRTNVRYGIGSTVSMTLVCSVIPSNHKPLMDLFVNIPTVLKVNIFFCELMMKQHKLTKILNEIVGLWPVFG